MIDVRDVLSQLSRCPAPAGYEGAAAKAASALLAPLVASVEIDGLGNLIGRLPCADPSAPTVLLDAHLDEVGLMVTGCENGFARFCALGGLDARVLPAAAVTLLTDPPTPGVVACLPPHVLTDEDRKKPGKLSELFIDTGGVDVPVGTPGVLDAEPVLLSDKLLSAKALDDRACFVTLLRALELLPAVELLRGKSRSVHVVVCGSVQEEAGCRGIKPAAFGVMPEYAVAVDVTYGRAPDTSREESFDLGGGPCLGVGCTCSRALTDQLVRTAKERHIPYQLEIMPIRTGTNGDQLQITGCGVATAVLSVPLRYMHTPVETVSLDDIENAARLLAEWMVSL